MSKVCPIVKPDSVKLSLSQDQFINVKRELNAGEYRAMLAGQYKESVIPDGPNGKEGGTRMVVDLDRMGLTKILAYGLDWSFVDLDDKPMELTEDTVKSIDVAWFREVLAAVDAHHEASETAADKRKNGQAGTPTSEAISASAA